MAYERFGLFYCAVYSCRKVVPAFFAIGLAVPFSQGSAQSIEVIADEAVAVVEETDNITITTIGDHAVRLLNGSGQILGHAGEIVIDAESTFGVFSTGVNAEITVHETGSIEVLNGNQGSHAIVAEGEAATVVNDGVIITNAQGVIGIFTSGMNSNVVNNGDIMTSGSGGLYTTDGIRGVGDDISIINTGTIRTTGQGASGVHVRDGANQIVNNTGVIMAEGGGISTGVKSFGSGVSITNSGEIYGAYLGVSSDGDGLSFENHGLVVGGRTGLSIFGDGSTGVNTGTITGEESVGVSFGGASFSNSGQISGGHTGLQTTWYDNYVENYGMIAGEHTGVQLSGFDSVFNNSGSIAGGVFGMVHGGYGASVRNTGSITGDNVGVVGGGLNMELANAGTITGDFAAVLIGGFHFNLVNSGDIASPAELDSEVESYALYVVGLGSHITLLPGSTLEGDIYFGKGAEGVDPIIGQAYSYNSLTLAKGFNTALTFSETETVGMPLVYSDSPFAVTDTMVAHVGATGFGAVDEVFNDLTGSIADALDERMAANRGIGGQSFSYERYGSEAPGRGGWFQLIGGYRSQEAGNSTLAFDNYLAGILGGVDRDLDDGRMAGLFAGYAYNEIAFDDDIVTTSTNSVFGGGYFSRTEDAYFINLAATVGASFNDNEREIANNMVVGGLETADSNYNGWFVSPAVTLGSRHAVSGGELDPSIRLRYSALFLDSYTETGSGANMSVDGRTAQVGEVRGQLAWREDKTTENGIFHSSLRVGVDGVFNWGDDVNATLYGQSLVFVDTDGSSIARGFLGGDFAFVPSAGNSSVTFGFEVGYDTTDALTAEARLGASHQF